MDCCPNHPLGALPGNTMLPGCCQAIVYPLSCALLIISAVALAGAFPHPGILGGLALGLGGAALTGRLFKVLSAPDDPTQLPSTHQEILFLVGSIALLILGFVGLAGSLNTVSLGGVFFGLAGGAGIALIAQEVWARRRGAARPPVRFAPPQQGAQHKPQRRRSSPDLMALPLPPEMTPAMGYVPPTREARGEPSQEPTLTPAEQQALLDEALGRPPRDGMAPVPTTRHPRGVPTHEQRETEARLEQLILQKRDLILSCRDLLGHPSTLPQWIVQAPENYQRQLQGERVTLPPRSSHSLRIKGSTTWLSQPPLSQENRRLFHDWIAQRTQLTAEQNHAIRTELLDSLTRLNLFSNLCLLQEHLEQVRLLIPLVCQSLQQQRGRDVYNPSDLCRQHGVQQRIQPVFGLLIDVLTGTLFAPLDLPSMGALFSTPNDPTVDDLINGLRALRDATPFRLSQLNASELILAICHKRVIPQARFQQIKNELPQEAP